MDVPSVAVDSTSLSVKDFRPPTEKQSKAFSLMVTSGGFGIERVGDGALDPPMPDAFSRVVQNMRLSDEQATDISIYHMVVYTNNKSAMRSNAVAMAIFGGVGGMIGGAVAGAVSAGTTSPQASIDVVHSLADQAKFEELAHDEYERAYFTKEENPKKDAVYVIYIDAEVNGMRVFTRSVVPIRPKDGKSNYDIAVMDAFKYYLAQLQGNGWVSSMASLARKPSDWTDAFFEINPLRMANCSWSSSLSVHPESPRFSWRLIGLSHAGSATCD